jgi:hypothetical protein
LYKQCGKELREISLPAGRMRLPAVSGLERRAVALALATLPALVVNPTRPALADSKTYVQQPALSGKDCDSP